MPNSMQQVANLILRVYYDAFDKISRRIHRLRDRILVSLLLEKKSQNIPEKSDTLKQG